MYIIKDEGIVIRKKDYGEADRVIVIFSKTHGKIIAYLKGIRKSRKREGLAADLTTVSEFIFYEKNDKIYISTMESKKSYFSISENLFKTSLVFYIFRFLDIVIQEKEPNERIYNMSLKFLDYVSEEKEKEKILTAVLYFLYKTIKIEGFFSDKIGIGDWLDLETFSISDVNRGSCIKLYDKEKKILECLNKVDIEGINRLKLRVNEITKMIENFEKFLELNLNEKLKIKYFFREDI